MTQSNKLHDQAFLSLDTETTGKDSHTARIVTVAMVVNYPGERKNVIKNWLINPGVEIPKEASDIHGITNEVAQADGMDPAVALREVSEAITKWEAKNLPVVIFNAQYDATLLLNEFARHNVEFNGTFKFVVDPYVLDKHFSFRKGKRTLEALSEFYGVTLSNAHEAEADAIASAEILRKISILNNIAMSIEELFTLQVNAKRKQSLSLQSYFRKTEPDTFIYTAWPYRTKESDAADELASPIQPRLV